MTNLPNDQCRGHMSAMHRDACPKCNPLRGWEPIEGAPKTSHSIMVWCAERKNTYIVTWSEESQRWMISGASWIALDQAPTHWRPLPTPPLTALDRVGDEHNPAETLVWGNKP